METWRETQGSKVVGFLGHMIKGRLASKETEEKDTIIYIVMPTLDMCK